MSKFTLYWSNGKTETVEGDTITAAVNAAGYGSGIAALSHYSTELEDPRWDYDTEKQIWNWKETKLKEF